jgi:hypothetical protein
MRGSAPGFLAAKSDNLAPVPSPWLGLFIAARAACAVLLRCGAVGLPFRADQDMHCVISAAVRVHGYFCRVNINRLERSNQRLGGWL